ncbi:asparagine synthase (glutamine-hydrolyzing) [Pelagibacterales bacterium SAG-MED30]|nr:asparagine synthase (glutamine-hydrolyzing) [Pelagibacterales bacterium SAG-MED30]
MCGINGIISKNISDIDINHVKKMNSILNHRGPDASEMWSNKSAIFGHTRLSIIDIDKRSNQPFIKDGLIITFNGEIYNYKDLKKKLPQTKWITNSDTEVVLELWRNYKEKSLNMLRGMFAFAIHDITTNDTFIVRDHFGIKPVYYYKGDKNFIFSSELKAIKAILPTKPEISLTGIVSSMMYAWIPEINCIYKSIKKLLPGQYIHINSDKINIKSYWSSKSLLDQPTNYNSKAESIKYLDKVLEDSVKNHLVSDVPVNAFLSGGLDSTLVVSMARKQLGKFDCFNIKFTDTAKKHESMADDAYYATKAGKYLDVRLNTIEVKPDLAKLLPKIVDHLDEPIGDSAAISTFLICDAARKAGVKVLLSGMGADEILGGYRKHLAMKIKKNLNWIPSKILSGTESLISNLPVYSFNRGNKIIRWTKRFLSIAKLKNKDAFFRSYTYYDTNLISEIFEFDASKKIQSIIADYDEFYNYSIDKRDLIDTMCFSDLNQFMVSLNLKYTDLASMAASTEVRVPFIDMEVIKAAFDINSNLKIKRLTQKYLLKKVAEKWLPNEIIYRPKSSFTLPLRAWIKNDLKDLVSDYLLSENGLVGRKIIKPQFIKKLINDEDNNREDNAQKIWHLLTLEQWFKNSEDRTTNYN